MLNIGLSEMLVIAILAIVFIGPDDLPEMMRFLGRQYAKLRRASDELRNAFQIETAMLAHIALLLAAAILLVMGLGDF